MFTKDDAINISNKLNISFDKFSIEEFLTGINIELEHGLVDKFTNVTNNDLELTAKIALAHLNEYPNYYNNQYGLSIFEEFLKSKLKWKIDEINVFYWKNLSYMLKL